MFLLGDWKHGECRLARRGLGAYASRVWVVASSRRTFMGSSRLAKAFGVASTRDGRAPQQCQGLTKTIGGPLLAAEAVRDRAGDSFVFEELPSQEVRGIEDA